MSPTPSPSPRSDLDQICVESSAAFPYHGLLLFVGQILLVLLIPILDREPRTMPVAYTVMGLATTLALMAVLDYRPCAVATLEGLCGILYPATLIARIASLPAGGSKQR